MPTKQLVAIEAKAFVPSRDFELSKRFYQALGFELAWATSDLAELRHGKTSFLLQNFHVPQCTENFMMHLLVEDVDAWWAHVSAAIAPFGLTVEAPADRPWGMRDFPLHDTSGVLWHIAAPIGE